MGGVGMVVAVGLVVVGVEVGGVGVGIGSPKLEGTAL